VVGRDSPDNTQHTTRTAPLSYERRLALRRMTIGADSWMDLVEIACDWEMPPCLTSTWTVYRIRELMATIILCHNDVCSLDKDRATIAEDNTVLAREALGHTPPQAVDLALTQLQADIDRWPAPRPTDQLRRKHRSRDRPKTGTITDKTACAQQTSHPEGDRRGRGAPGQGAGHGTPRAT
jgi:hypothetical protein